MTFALKSGVAKLTRDRLLNVPLADDRFGLPITVCIVIAGLVDCVRSASFQPLICARC